MKKTLSFILTAAMIFAIMPFCVFSAVAEEMIVIESIEFVTDISEPVLGEELYFPEIYSVNGDTELVDLVYANISWYSCYCESDDYRMYSYYSYETFNGGNAYTLRFDVYANDGAVFSDDAYVTLFTPDGEVTADQGDDYGVYNHEFNAFFPMIGEASDIFVIESIEMTVDTPSDGAPIGVPEVYSINGRSDLADLIAVSSYWGYGMTGSENFDDYYGFEEETFKSGYAYALYLDVYCEAETAFAEDCAFTMITPDGNLNGGLIDHYGYQNVEFDVYFGFLGEPMEPIIIESVEFTADASAPAVGADIYYPQLYSINGDTSLVAEEALMNFMLWGCFDEYSEDVTDYMYMAVESETFESGNAYCMLLLFMPNVGYEIADDCVVTVKAPEGDLTVPYVYPNEENINIYYALFDLTGADDFILGDANGDGKINARDYARVKRYCLNTLELSEEELLAADVNGDGKVNARDYGLIKRHCLGTYVIGG